VLKEKKYKSSVEKRRKQSMSMRIVWMIKKGIIVEVSDGVYDAGSGCTIIDKRKRPMK
jgi:hypothetical protein